jgi:hypothetical protein
MKPTIDFCMSKKCGYLNKYGGCVYGSDVCCYRQQRKAFICIHCEGVYMDVPVTQCDCLEGTGHDFIEGVLNYNW